MCSFRITPDSPAVIPCLGPRSNRRSKKGSVRTTYDGEISKRITDPKLIESLSRDTKIRINPPQTGNKMTKSAQPTSPRFKNRNSKNIESSSTISFNSSQSNNNKANDNNDNQNEIIRHSPRFPKYVAQPYRPHVENPELDEQAESYLNGEEDENISIEECQNIKSQFKKLRAYLVQERDYHQAIVVHQKLIQLDAKIWELDHYTDELYDTKHRMMKHKEIEQIVKIYLEDWESSFSEFLESAQLEADQIQEENKTELEEFDSQIPQELTFDFRKPSRKLIDIRNAERRLALDNQISFAMRLKKMGDKMEQQEAQQAYKKQKRLYREKRNRLIKAQQEKIKVFYDHINTVKVTLVQQRDKLIKGYLYRLNYLDKKLDQDAEELKIKVEKLCSSRINQDRLDYVQNEELGVSIPRSRPSAGYNITVKRKANSSSANGRKRSSQRSTVTPVSQKPMKTYRRSGYKFGGDKY